jgi:hypothetical protein
VAFLAKSNDYQRLHGGGGRGGGGREGIQEHGRVPVGSARAQANSFSLYAQSSPIADGELVC